MYANFTNSAELCTVTINLNGGKVYPLSGRDDFGSPIVMDRIEKGKYVNNFGMDGATKEGYVFKYLVDEDE